MENYNQTVCEFGSMCLIDAEHNSYFQPFVSTSKVSIPKNESKLKCKTTDRRIKMT